LKLHHLGIACTDINETLASIQKMVHVTSISAIVHDPEQDADLCMVTVRDSLPIELISGPAVQGFVKRGISLYHTCWEVSDIEKTISQLCGVDCRIVSEPKRAILFDHRRVAFLSSPLGLLELVES